MLKCKQTELLKIEQAGKDLLSQWLLLLSSVVERWGKREGGEREAGAREGGNEGEMEMEIEKEREEEGEAEGERPARYPGAHRLGVWAKPWAVAPSSGTKVKPRSTGHMAHCKEPTTF